MENVSNAPHTFFFLVSIYLHFARDIGPIGAHTFYANSPLFFFPGISSVTNGINPPHFLYMYELLIFHYIAGIGLSKLNWDWIDIKVYHESLSSSIDRDLIAFTFSIYTILYINDEQPYIRVQSWLSGWVTFFFHSILQEEKMVCLAYIYI